MGGSGDSEEATGKSQCQLHSPTPGAGIHPGDKPWSQAHHGHDAQLATEHTASISPITGP